MVVNKDIKNIEWVDFKYEWIWEKDNGSNFVNVKHQPFKVHEQVLVFGKAPTTYNKKGRYMIYNPQMTNGKSYKMKRKGMTRNLAASNEYKRINGEYGDVRYPRSVLNFNIEKGLHPTQKPTSLFDYLINTYTNKNDIVVDCCCGSGTTAISCLNTGRQYIVNDNEYKYFQTTKERINTHKKLLTSI